MPMPVSVIESYDRYFASRLYDQRYPRANPSTLAVVLDQLGKQGRRVLDVGCGNGRYAEALLERTPASIVACDISPQAIVDLSSRYAAHVASGRLRPLLGDLSVVASSLGPDEKFDLVIMLFGVLAHIYSRALRGEALAAIRALLRPGGRIVLTVPNAARRFSREQTAAQKLIKAGHLEAGDILYERASDDGVVEMYYHLYSLGEFVQELEQQGFRMRHVGAESVLPESGVVRSKLLGKLDGVLTTFVPLRYAYGFLAVAEVANEEDATEYLPPPMPRPPAPGKAE
jgi:SAM-dependent methyltransferase